MSGFIVPAIAIGGVYLLYEGFTKKKSKNHSSSSTSSSTSKNRSSSSSHTKKHKKHKKASSVSSIEGLKVKHNQTRKLNRIKKEQSIREISVFYTYGSVKGKKWSYNNLPSGWSLKKKIDAKSGSKYTKVAVFSGPRKNRDSIKKYLNNAFEYLKKKNIVKHYKITGEHNQ